MFCVQIAAGFKPSILDVGGGFPGTSDAGVLFEEVQYVDVSTLVLATLIIVTCIPPIQ